MHQLTHNTTTDCSLNYEFSTWKLQAQNMLRTCCVHELFWMSKQNKKRTICVLLSLEFSCTEQWTRNSMNNPSSYCGLVDTYKNKCFWKRFTSTQVVGCNTKYIFHCYKGLNNELSGDCLCSKIFLSVFMANCVYLTDCNDFIWKTCTVGNRKNIRSNKPCLCSKAWDIAGWLNS